MVAVLLDSFEQPLSSTKTPSNAVAIKEPTSAAIFGLLVDFFSCAREPGFSDDGLESVFSCGFVSGFADNPSCVKCAIFGLLCWFPQLGTVGARWQPLGNE